MSIEWPDRDSREWLVGPRGGELGSWEEAIEHLPAIEGNLAALLCVPQSAPTIWVRDDLLDQLDLWDVLKSLVMAYDAGDRDPDTWTEVLDGQGHLAILGAD